MNRKIYRAILAALTCLAIGFLTSCSSYKSTPPPPPPPPPPVCTGTTYVFYLSGEEAINGGFNQVDVAGAVTIDSTGKVLCGEQDYNDAFGLTSPGEPNTPDSITGGTLTVDGTTGQGTLTLVTNNSSIGVSGTETLGVQFVNVNHALIMQFDGTATSSGSMDFQTLPGAGGNFAFTLSGVDPSYLPVAFGGVYTAGSGSVMGTIDVNDAGTLVTGTTFNATVGTTDGFGRSVVTGVANPVTATPISFASYVVGPEVERIIDVDAADNAIGSGFGQGSATFSNASLGASVFGVEGNWDGSEFASAGQFTTSNTSSDPASFSGLGTDNEMGNGVGALDVSTTGTYSLQSSGINGYGSLTFSSSFGDVVSMGLYMTDPSLNLNDPNNTSGSVGGALLLDLDLSLAGGIGVVTPQTDTSTSSFDGNYAVGFQEFNTFNSSFPFSEVDVLAQGTMTSGALSLTGLISDPFTTLTTATTDSGVTFTGTPLADSTNAGHYTMFSTNPTPNPLAVNISGATGAFNLDIFQASGGQLYWIEVDPNGVFLGPLEQQGSLTGIPAARKPGGNRK